MGALVAGTAKRLWLGPFRASLTLALLLLTIGAPARADDGLVHEGVASCASTTCHARLAPTGKIVRQNEISTWQSGNEAGAHSRAYTNLMDSQGEDIAARLNLGHAENAKSCLGCHSDDAAKPGDQFQLRDGVGCESCHGGADKWLHSHYAVPAKHIDNIKAGMIPLDDPRRRADVCLDCHFGSAKPGYKLTHEMMAAGHPRVSFELDLFGALQSHYDFDDDYRARGKEIPGGVKLWTVGQAMALERVLTSFGERQDGMFPDFYLYDCQSCHRALTDTHKPEVNAVSNPDRRIQTGTPVFDDENMIMLAAAVDLAAPQLADRFRSDVAGFHAALARDRASAVQSASNLASTAHKLADAFAEHSFGCEDNLKILTRLVEGATTQRYTDYGGGAQAMMSIETLLRSLVISHDIPEATVDAMGPDRDLIYQGVHDPNLYRSAEFRGALARVASAVRRLRCADRTR
jgi:hypothetical protein